MKFNNVCIESLGYFLPDEIVSSEAIELRLSTLRELKLVDFGPLEHFQATLEPKQLLKP